LAGELTILKLGGSVLTKKDRPLTVNLAAMRRLAREIKNAGTRSLLIIHGGGSFGHPLAKRYRIMEGLKDESQIIGFSRVHRAMMELNAAVVDALLEEGLPALPVSPSSFASTEGGELRSLETDLLTKYLRMGLLPVLYGDVVLDSKKGFSILSGDQLVSKLAIELRSRLIVIGVDVDGLFSSDPKEDAGAKLFRRISLKNLDRVKLKPSKNIDVTGGMPFKVKELSKVVEKGRQVLLVNALTPRRIYKALLGEEVIGTVIDP